MNTLESIDNLIIEVVAFNPSRRNFLKTTGKAVALAAAIPIANKIDKVTKPISNSLENIRKDISDVNVTKKKYNLINKLIVAHHKLSSDDNSKSNDNPDLSRRSFLLNSITKRSPVYKSMTKAPVVGAKIGALFASNNRYNKSLILI